MKYYGELGYCEYREGEYSEYIPVWTKRNYYGDVIRFGRRLDVGVSIADDVTVSDSLSIVADPYALSHFHNLRYAEWQGAKWKITNVEINYPRMILTLGGMYNEPINSETTA